MKTLRHFLLPKVAVLAAVCCFSPLLSAAVIPYEDDFQTTAVGSNPAGWTTQGTGTWSVVNKTDSSEQVYQVVSGQNSSTASSLRLENIDTDLGGFMLTSTFTITDSLSVVGNQYIGFAAYGSNASLGSLYIADIRGNGVIRLISNGSGSASYEAGDKTDLGTALAEGVTYTMVLTGVYAEDGLRLNFSVTDGINTAIASGFDTNPRTGEYFGLRLNSNAADTFTVQFDSFAATQIPEPGTVGLAMGAIALGGLLLRLRRRG